MFDSCVSLHQSFEVRFDVRVPVFVFVETHVRRLHVRRGFLRGLFELFADAREKCAESRAVREDIVVLLLLLLCVLLRKCMQGR